MRSDVPPIYVESSKTLLTVNLANHKIDLDTQRIFIQTPPNYSANSTEIRRDSDG
ncbi:MAG: hypothetical protein JSV64_07710 [Candidatus Bathyarchaeota archaeon]|nr:MAG: hypothetical protein JSV64_07710 [Candidatus Bathyarchaeota archaeon]